MFLRHILKHGVESAFRVEPWSRVIFFEWRFEVTIANSIQENIWKNNHALTFRAEGHVLISGLVWPCLTL